MSEVVLGCGFWCERVCTNVEIKVRPICRWWHAKGSLTQILLPTNCIFTSSKWLVVTPKNYHIPSILSLQFQFQFPLSLCEYLPNIRIREKKLQKKKGEEILCKWWRRFPWRASLCWGKRCFQVSWLLMGWGIYHFMDSQILPKLERLKLVWFIECTFSFCFIFQLIEVCDSLYIKNALITIQVTKNYNKTSSWQKLMTWTYNKLLLNRI